MTSRANSRGWSDGASAAAPSPANSRRGDMTERRGKAESVADTVASFLKSRGLDVRVGRASILIEWAALVGPQIARVTTPRQITDDGTLFVAVQTHGWMTELSLMEVQLLAKINAREGREPIRRIRWELAR
ncbi:MAG: hypothetical protein CK531_04600 [Gemmatimonadetes bacterium]|nr:MAG: hypothetical protein CK531_04600 [Gemmatimonadota bacterium]